ncbi:helix-turn-helix domain-containing protein [Chryseobacterium capnotolerans]|uniref:helix-turn-helix domain-containing protein n=1 Tax=Chryseobacterium capnotolerans TaxID=2759528 RepID=UPI001E4F2F26|nr:AraC family transcriptional regulator [Chryseobacterium capnotolerans]
MKSVTQKSPKQWINEIDINYSKALLHSSKDIAEIAYELNFHTASHFTQLFKKNCRDHPEGVQNSVFEQ